MCHSKDSVNTLCCSVDSRLINAEFVQATSSSQLSHHQSGGPGERLSHHQSGGRPGEETRSPPVREEAQSPRVKAQWSRSQTTPQKCMLSGNQTSEWACLPLVSAELLDLGMAEQAAKKVASPLYLGFDFSTQQLKLVCVDNELNITHEFSIEFERELPEFSTVGGVVKHEDGVTVTTPTILWVKALDLLLAKMQKEGFPFARVVAMSGSGQQHGSVYWRKGSEGVLGELNPTATLASQLKTCFSVPDSPVWMDSSTTAQCRQLEETCGGPQEVANKTGSRAYERFTGNQIAKIFQQKQKDYEETERISLVSSFGATLLLGHYAPIDYSDGSGMNLMDIQLKDWWQTALDACAPNLQEKLGKPVPSKTVLGNISNYFVERYGFSQDCKVVAFTGDNPASLAGMRLDQGDVVMSLGTSDTLFLWINKARPQLMGHTFVNPVDAQAFMAMLCYKNGSQTREMIRNSCANGSWKAFNELLEKTDPGNNGNIGIYFEDPEITPAGQGIFQQDNSGTAVDQFPPEVEVRAILESQIMAKFVHARNLGYQITGSSRVLATGGASQNPKILQIIADVFNTDVYTLEETANSASLGCAYRAKHALMPEGTRFLDAVRNAAPYKHAVSPRADVHEQVYLPLTRQYSEFERTVAESQ